MLLNLMHERQKKYHKYMEQFNRVSETLSVLNRVKDSVDSIVPKLNRLNSFLPPEDQLETFDIKSKTMYTGTDRSSQEI